MGKNKKRNRWNSQPRKQENPLAQQQKMVAPKAVRDYWANNLTPDEQQIFNTPIAVAQQAGVMQRLGYLTAAFLHIHSVQSLLFGEMQNIVEDWGLLIKGVQPVINSLLNSEDKFFNVMHDLVKNQSTGIIIEQDIANKGMAAIKARNLAKKNPDKMYVLFEQRMQVQETCHMTPFKAVQKPADQDEVVNVKIEPMKKGKKPKE